MSEARKNRFEIISAWLGFLGSIFTIFVSLVMLISNISILTSFPGTNLEYETYFLSFGGQEGFNITSVLLDFMPILYVATLVVGIAGLLFSLFRTNMGIRLSGIILFLTSGICILCFISINGVLAYEEAQIASFIAANGTAQDLAVYGITVPYGLLLPSFGWVIPWNMGSFLMMAAAPMNEAKFRTRRMKTLARADTAERAGRPREAIRLYFQAGDISMKLREEDKASEYYAKSREIREVAIQAVLEAEEKRKREELAARRSKLEEQRREILMRADRAEEKDDWARAAVIYKEAASLSVDLGEKKLAAQFTAKAKELQKRAKKARKERKEPPPPPE